MAKSIGTVGTLTKPSKGETPVDFIPALDFKGTLDGTNTILFKKGKVYPVTKAQGDTLVKGKKGTLAARKGAPAEKGPDAPLTVEQRVTELMKAKKDELVKQAVELGIYDKAGDADQVKKEDVAQAIAEQQDAAAE